MSTGGPSHKRCSRCSRVKPTAQFAWRRIAQGQHDSYCRDCRAAYKKEHYAANRQRYLENASALRSRVFAERWAYLAEYLRSHPCVDCGENDPLVLEFDHLADKEFGISAGLAQKSWGALRREMGKCEVVCANCHRRRSAAQHGYLRAVLLADVDPCRAGDR